MLIKMAICQHTEYNVHFMATQTKQSSQTMPTAVWPNICCLWEFRLIKSLMTSFIGKDIRMSLWTLHAATLFKRFWVIVLRRYVFSLRKQLKLRSASHDEAGRTSMHRMTLTTSENSCLISAALDFITSTLCSTLLYTYDDLNIGSWTDRRTESISGYDLMPSVTRPLVPTVGPPHPSPKTKSGGPDPQPRG